jgi:phosphoglycolate phosphatase-like HAD superfamily hydrolase
VLRVAFDLDGTLADMERVLRRMASDLFKNAAPNEAVESGASEDARRAAGKLKPDPTNLDLTPSEWRRLWAHVRRTEDFWLSLPEIDDGIVARIAALATERRWEIVFLTTRPKVRGQTTQVQSQKWLEAHGFARPSVLVVQRSRGLIAHALELDAVVDDRLENCVDVALESKAAAILIRPSSSANNQSRPVGVRVVGSIREAVALLEQTDDDRHRPGVVRSIRKLLGR